MKKGQEYIGTISEIQFPNKGIIYYEELKEQGLVTTKVTIPGGIKGQKVKFLLTKKRSSKCEGRVIDILEKSE